MSMNALIRVLATRQQDCLRYAADSRAHVELMAECAALGDSVVAMTLVEWLAKPGSKKSLFFDQKKQMWVATDEDGCGCRFDKWAPTLRELADALSPNTERSQRAAPGGTLGSRACSTRGDE